jgi:hypothetical protein
MGGPVEESKKLKDIDEERKKTLEELRALRQKRLESTGKPAQPSISSQSTANSGTVADKQMGTSAVSIGDEDKEIARLRATRMQHEAYQDILRLRKQADQHEHEAAKYMTKAKSFDHKAQRAITKAVQNRKRAEACRERMKDISASISELEKEMKSAATEDTGVIPEKIRLKIAKLEKKNALLEQKAKKYEAKASMLNERAALYKAKAASNMEQSKIHEAEAKNLTERADKLESISG